MLSICLNPKAWDGSVWKTIGLCLEFRIPPLWVMETYKKVREETPEAHSFVFFAKEREFK